MATVVTNIYLTLSFDCLQASHLSLSSHSTDTVPRESHNVVFVSFHNATVELHSLYAETRLSLQHNVGVTREGGFTASEPRNGRKTMPAFFKTYRRRPAPFATHNSVMVCVGCTAWRAQSLSQFSSRADMRDFAVLCIFKHALLNICQSFSAHTSGN